MKLTRLVLQQKDIVPSSSLPQHVVEEILAESKRKKAKLSKANTAVPGIHDNCETCDETAQAWLNDVATSDPELFRKMESWD